MAKVTVKKRGTIRVDPNPAVEEASKAILDHMRARFDRRVDVDDKPLAQYSELYRMQLEAIGESPTPDGKRTGATLAAVQRLRVRKKGTRVTMTFGVRGRGAAPAPRPPPWCFIGPPAKRAAALARWRSSTKKAQRSYPLKSRMWLLAHGRRGRPGRHMVGVSRRGFVSVIQAIERARIFRST